VGRDRMGGYRLGWSNPKKVRVGSVVLDGPSQLYCEVQWTGLTDMVNFLTTFIHGKQIWLRNMVKKLTIKINRN